MLEQSVEEKSVPISPEKPLVPKPLGGAQPFSLNRTDSEVNVASVFSKERFYKLHQLVENLVQKDPADSKLQNVYRSMRHIGTGELSDSKIEEIMSVLRSESQMLKETLRTEGYFLPTLKIVRNLFVASDNQHADKFGDFAMSFIEENIGYLETAIHTNPDNKVKLKAFQTGAIWLYMKGDRSQKELAVDFLVKNCETVSKAVSVKDREELADDVRLVLGHANTEEKEKIYKLITRMYTHLGPGVVQFVPKDARIEHSVPGDKEFLEKYGLDSKSFTQAWSESSRPKELTKISDINMKMISRIEAERPGIAKELSDDFGIRDFARYPKEMLIAQYDQRGNANIPYGVILNPREDWNGGFYYDRGIFESLGKQLDSLGYGVRIFEVGSKYEIARALIKLDQRYGQNHKISFAIIGGHGTWENIDFGSDELDKRDLQGQGMQRASKFFESSPTIILHSCEAGANRGIASEISKLGGRVIGPDQSTSLKSIKVELGNDTQLHFKVEYRPTGIDPRLARTGRSFSEGKTESLRTS